MDLSRGARPLIGVTASERGGLWMAAFNRLAVWRAGGRALKITPANRQDLKKVDALVIGGGDDISAALYGGVTNPAIRPAIRIDQERDRLEMEALSFADTRNIPVLGICRGAQMMNVALGGSLHQDIHTTFPDAPRLRTPLPRKTVALQPGSRIAGLLGVSSCRVNALHHQSVDRLATGLTVVGRDDFGIVQAIEAVNGMNWIGVQWHPEFLVFDRRQQRLFSHLVRQIQGLAAGVGAAA